MDWFSGIIVYLMIFWTALFAVLPWGVRPHQEAEHGTAGSAPENPQIRKKFLITGIISAMIWIFIYILIEIQIIDFYEISRMMFEDDYGPQ